MSIVYTMLYIYMYIHMYIYIYVLGYWLINAASFSIYADLNMIIRHDVRRAARSDVFFLLDIGLKTQRISMKSQQKSILKWIIY